MNYSSRIEPQSVAVDDKQITEPVTIQWSQANGKITVPDQTLVLHVEIDLEHVDEDLDGEVGFPDKRNGIEHTQKLEETVELKSPVIVFESFSKDLVPISLEIYNGEAEIHFGLKQ